MTKKDRVFIARQIAVLEYGFQRIDKEVIFDSFRKAENFIKNNSDLKCSFEEMKSIRMEIISTVVNNLYPWKNNTYWNYDLKGRLIPDRYPGYQLFDKRFSKEFKGKYDFGELVFIKALPWNKFSHRGLDTIGVISYKPLKLDKWIKSGEKAKEWLPLYTVEYINTDGYLDHDHCFEQGIIKFKKELPKDLTFLKILRNHYLGKSSIEESALKKIYNCEMMVRNVSFFSIRNLKKMEEKNMSPS
jgi:hypothetical protein